MPFSVVARTGAPGLSRCRLWLDVRVPLRGALRCPQITPAGSVGATKNSAKLATSVTTTTDERAHEPAREEVQHGVSPHRSRWWPDRRSGHLPRRSERTPHGCPSPGPSGSSGTCEVNSGMPWVGSLTAWPMLVPTGNAGRVVVPRQSREVLLHDLLVELGHSLQLLVRVSVGDLVDLRVQRLVLQLPQLLPVGDASVWNSTGNQQVPLGQSEHQPAGAWPMLTGAL